MNQTPRPLEIPEPLNRLYGLVHLRQVATHSGEYDGMPATGTRTDIEVMDLFRVEGDRLVEHWALMDNLDLLKQIGAVDA